MHQKYMLGYITVSVFNKSYSISHMLKFNKLYYSFNIKY